MSRRLLILLTGLFIVFGSVFGIIIFKNKMMSEFMAAYVPPPVTVQITPVELTKWDQTLHAVGTLRAVNGVEVSGEVGGIVNKILFTAGQEVESNQILLQLEDSVEQANLRSLEAQLRLAEINYKRDKQLLTTRSISRTDFDKTEAQYNDAIAQVERTKAIISQKLIRAPFKGKLGIQNINLGQYINQGEPLVTLQALDTLYVDFNFPERYLPRLAIGQEVNCTVDAYPGAIFKGQVDAINVKVDNNTHSIRLRAKLANQTAKLLPSMFVGVTVVLGEPLQLVTVPVTAISYSLFGDSVYVVKEKQEGADNQLYVERRFIKTGVERLLDVAISDGLEVGENVVTAGQLKLRNGAAVLIDTTTSL